jgi:polyferredoxin
MFFESTILKEIRSSAFILFGIVLFLSVLFGPVFCGWICPFGSVQELISKAGKKLFKNKFNNFINPKLDSVLRYTRYLVLIYILYITAKSGYLIFKDFDPYSTLFGFWREFSIGGLVILAIVILMSFIMERPWCKYLCPYGAMLGITNTFRIFKIQRNPTACISCNACNKSCPMNIDIEKNINVKNHQCITCLDCTSENACPKDSTLELSSSKYKEEVYNDEN